MSRYLTFTMALAAGAFSLAPTARAQSAPPVIDHVEEDWQVVIDTPDTTANGPQITTTMSPYGDNTAGPYPAFDMNYREYPTYVPGGMQIQVWNSTALAGLATQGRAQLNTQGETITWTQAMTLLGGNVIYTVNNGDSQTWGDFGENGQLTVTYASSLTDLSAYSPDVSAANSGVTWQSNHVTSMAIVQVRYYSQGQLILTDTTRRDIALPY
jgi:hypothetical protein